MSSTIPEISITEFKKLKAQELKRLRSCEVFADGDYLFTFVNSTTDYIRTQVEGLAYLSNTQGGEDPEDILRKEETVGV